MLLIWQNGAEDVKKHRWFKTIDWDTVPNRKLKVNIQHSYDFYNLHVTHRALCRLLTLGRAG